MPQEKEKGEGGGARHLFLSSLQPLSASGERRKGEARRADARKKKGKGDQSILSCTEKKGRERGTPGPAILPEERRRHTTISLDARQEEKGREGGGGIGFWGNGKKEGATCDR